MTADATVLALVTDPDTGPAQEPPLLAVSIREEWAVQYPPLVPGWPPYRYRCPNEWVAMLVADGNAGATVVRREVTITASEWGTG